MAHPFNIMANMGLSCNGVLQVGASFGHEVEPIVNSGSKLSVLIEALPEPYSVLVNKIKPYIDIIAVNALCSNMSGMQVNFNVANNHGMSSSILKPNLHLKIHPEVKFEHTTNLVTTTVDDVCAAVAKKYQVQTWIMDTLLMDVQGAELLVLEGATNLLESIIPGVTEDPRFEGLTCKKLAIQLTT